MKVAKAKGVGKTGSGAMKKPGMAPMQPKAPGAPMGKMPFNKGGMVKGKKYC